MNLLEHCMKRYIFYLLVICDISVQAMNTIGSLPDILNLLDDKFENIRREEREDQDKDETLITIESYYANVFQWLLSAHKRVQKDDHWGNESFDGGVINFTTGAVFPITNIQASCLFFKLKDIWCAQNKKVDIRNNFDNRATTEKIKHPGIKVAPFRAGKTLQILKEQQKME